MRILTLILLFPIICSAQTDIVKLRSLGSSDMAALSDMKDNFGMPVMPTTIDTVYLFDTACLIEVKRQGGWRYRDTVCDHPYLRRYADDLSKIKQHYSPETVFIGFKKKKKPSKGGPHYFFNGFDLNWGSILVVLLFISGFRFYLKSE